MKLIRYMWLLLACMSLYLMSTVPTLAQEADIAIIYKFKGGVELKATDQSDWLAVDKRGTRLSDNDRLRTLDDGFAVIMFTDDKSQVKVKPNSELQISGNREGSTVSKRIGAELGEMLISVTQQKGDLRVETPTAVASVKGTLFETAVEDDQRSMFTVLEGIVEVTTVMDTVTVSANQKAQAGADGSLNVTDLGPGEGEQLENGYETIESGVPKTFQMEFKSPDGDTKTIQIDAFEQEQE